MSDREKFAGFKKRMIAENEANYGAEIRERYGDDVVERSNQKFMNMTEEQYDEFVKLGEKVNDMLREALKTGDPGSELAQQVADLHRQWLCYTWDHYSREAHAGVAQMYTCDPRFTAYYDKIQPGAAEFLRDAVFIYTGMHRTSVND